MNHIALKYNGTLPGLAAFLEAHFKNPQSIPLEVSCIIQAPISQESALNELIEKMVAQYHLEERREHLKEGLPEVFDFIRRGTKINAIKTLREITRFGLKEAKELVEGDLLTAYLLQYPEQEGVID